jgi:hypothetical protein
MRNVVVEEVRRIFWQPFGHRCLPALRLRTVAIHPDNGGHARVLRQMTVTSPRASTAQAKRDVASPRSVVARDELER